MLTIVATPIGNLKDITLRTLEVLKSSDGIICEDTRRSSILFNHYGIKKPLIVLNDFNEVKVIPQILNRLLQAENLSLVSDAGTPLIADPGYKLVREALSADIKVDSVPGPSSVITALTLSSLPPDKFLFLGFLPEKQGQRVKLIELLKEINARLKTTFIIMVAPHKLIKVLEDIKQILGDLDLIIASELTKIHQSVTKKSVSAWQEEFRTKNPKGELTLLFNLG